MSRKKPTRTSRKYLPRCASRYCDKGDGMGAWLSMGQLSQRKKKCRNTKRKATLATSNCKFAFFFRCILPDIFDIYDNSTL